MSWEVGLGVVVLGFLFFLLVFTLAFLAGLGWKFGRGQVVVAHYELGEGNDLAKVKYDSKTDTMVFKHPPVCSVCAEKRRLEELNKQLNDPEEQL